MTHILRSAGALRRCQAFVSATALVLVVSVQSQGGQGSVRAVALGLAQRGVRTGVVLSVSDFEALKTDEAYAGNVSVTHPTPLTIDDTLQRFREEYPDFLVRRSATSATFVHRDAPSAVLEKLNRLGMTTTREQLSISAALVEVVGSLINGSAISGVIGSGQMPGPTCPLGAAVRVPAAQSTPIGTLDNLVAQVPGVSWFVLYDSDRAGEPLYLGLWCQNGMNFRVQLPR
jgi:hypothetical protein